MGVAYLPQSSELAVIRSKFQIISVKINFCGFLRYPVKRVVRKLHVENTRTDELIISILG